MKWIGLTGGLASGKSTVAGLLRTKGYPVIDADEIAKLVTAPGSAGLSAVAKTLGGQFLSPDGSLNRRELGQKVFNDAALLLRLEGILHPLVQAEVESRRRQFSQQGFRLAFYDVPLLFEKKISGFDSVIVVTTTLDLQKSRAQSRNGWDLSEIDQRLANQIPLSEKEAKANFVIHNDSDIAHLDAQVDALLPQL